MITPTIEHAIKLRDLMRKHGIVKGLGEPIPGKMCIEALICHVLGLPHGDNPKECVGFEVNRFKIDLNDKPWTSPQARAKGMERLGIAQLGSNIIDQREFKDATWLAFGQKLSPLIFRYQAAKTENKQPLLEHANVMEKVVTLSEARQKQKEFAHAHDYAYAYAHGYAHDYAYAYAHAHDYAYGYGYGYGYGYDYGYGYGYGYGYDVWFTKVADLAVQVLKDLKSPGCEWLWICDEV
jgi:hypothetical protein